MIDISPEFAYWLPIIFMGLMGLAILIYVVLDGYDLGVGMLMSQASEADKDKMIASIGPFWDANETWLVLGVGILLVAFPLAHGAILTALYLPTALMLGGLIMRGVAFDFRAKAQVHKKRFWDHVFVAGSGLATVTQGYMLALYIVGFERSVPTVIFGALAGLCLASGYIFVGASWLIMKAEGALQRQAVRWARVALWGTALGLAAVSAVTPLVSERIFDRWFSLPNFLFLLPIPIITGGAILVIDKILQTLPRPKDAYCWAPFLGSILLFVLGFFGLAYSFFPYIVQDSMTIWEAASAPEALVVILAGAIIVIPFILGYTAYVYKVFWGKTRDLCYG